MTIENVEFYSLGAPLRGAIYYPGSESRGSVVTLHGFTGSRAEMQAAYYAQAGYTVLAYDHPSHGESEGNFGWNELLAGAVDAIDTLLDATGDIGVHVAGLSLGGMLVCLLNDPRILARVAMSSPASVLSLINNVARGRPEIPFEKGNLHTTLGRMVDFALNSPRYQPIDGVKDADCILFVQGTKDDLVDTGDAQKLYGEAQEPKSIVLLEGADHVYTGRSDHLEAAVAWINEF